MKRSFLFMAVALLSVVCLSFAAVNKPVRATLDANGPEGAAIKAPTPSKSPGDTVGFTSLDWVHNGPMGGAIVADKLGNLHFGYTYRNAAGTAGSRTPQYNFLNASGWLGATDVAASGRWGTVGCKPTTGVGLFAYYYTAGSTYPTMLGIDADAGVGMFDIYGVDNSNPLDQLSAHPYLAVASDDTMYLLADGDADEFVFNYSYDGGVTWGTWVDLSQASTSFVTDFPEMNIAAKGSKVAISSYCVDYHMMYRESDDFGATWKDAVMVVDGLNGTALGTDSIGCYIHGVPFYDAAGNLHIVNSAFTWSADTTGAVPYFEGIVHWSEATGLNWVHKEANTAVNGGSNTLTCSWPWITQMDDGTLVVSYTHFVAEDIAANGTANGDIWAAKSTDGGANWFNQTNITNSVSNGAADGACEDDRYPACAAVGDSIHFFWLNSKVAGTSLLGELTAMSFDPLLHYAVHKDDITGVAGLPPTRPSSRLVLNQNRPNPVSGNTAISFSLPRASDYTLKVYNVAGQVVSTISGRGQAGNNSVSWNSRDVSNGVYFYQLNAAGSTATRKMIVVK